MENYTTKQLDRLQILNTGSINIYNRLIELEINNDKGKSYYDLLDLLKDNVETEKKIMQSITFTPKTKKRLIQDENNMDYPELRLYGKMQMYDNTSDDYRNYMRLYSNITLNNYIYTINEALNDISFDQIVRETLIKIKYKSIMVSPQYEDDFVALNGYVQPIKYLEDQFDLIDEMPEALFILNNGINIFNNILLNLKKLLNLNLENINDITYIEFACCILSIRSLAYSTDQEFILELIIDYIDDNYELNYITSTVMDEIQDVINILTENKKNNK